MPVCVLLVLHDYTNIFVTKTNNLTCLSAKPKYYGIYDFLVQNFNKKRRIK